MGKMKDLYITIEDTIERLLTDNPSGNTEQLDKHVQSNADTSLALKAQSALDAGIRYRAWDSAATNLSAMRDGNIPADEGYVWAVRDFFQMDRRLPREESKMAVMVCKQCGEKVFTETDAMGTRYNCFKCGPTDALPNQT